MEGFPIRGVIITLSDCLDRRVAEIILLRWIKAHSARTHTVVNGVESSVTLSTELMRVATGLVDGSWVSHLFKWAKRWPIQLASSQMYESGLIFPYLKN